MNNNLILTFSLSCTHNILFYNNIQSLRAHLINNRDPQLGTIMRCVDESLIYHFMEKYKGFTMSVQAILTLVGNSLGTTLVNQEVIINDSEELLDAPGTTDTTTSHDSHNERADRPTELGATRRSQQTGRRQLPALEFDDSRHNTPSTAAPRSPGSRGRSRGLLDATPTAGSIRGKSHSRGAVSANDREFVSNEARMHPHARSGRVGNEKEHTEMGDAVTGILPRRYRAERSISPKSNPAWAGGFRAVHPRTDGAHSPNRPVAPLEGVIRPSSVPIGHTRGHSSSGTGSHRPPKSASHSMSTSQSLVVFGSENLRLSAASMGFAPDQSGLVLDINHNEKAADDDNQSLFSHRSMMSNDSYHTSVPSNAIAAMHEQLVEENLLPSMQPEPVLSEEQIRDLGLHKKTFNQIMQEIKKTGSHQSLDTDSALHIQKPHLSQYDTGTPQITDSMPNSPRESSVHSQMMGSMKSSGNVNAIVSNLMSTSAPIRSLFVEPLSATIDVPSPPKYYNSLYGSVYSAADKERFQHLAAMEIERGEQRFGIESPPHHKLPLGRPYEGYSPGKSGKLAELVKPPIAIKTREGRVDENNTPIPLAPYSNFQEESHVINAGVPAGSGLMLWRPRYRVSREGRYRAGQSRVRIKHSLQEGPVRKPFVSAA